MEHFMQGLRDGFLFFGVCALWAIATNLDHINPHAANPTNAPMSSGVWRFMVALAGAVIVAMVALAAWGLM